MGYIEGTKEVRTSVVEPHMLSGVKEWHTSAASVGKAFLAIRGFLLSPIPAHYAETSHRHLGQYQALPPRETWVIRNQVHTEIK